MRYGRQASWELGIIMHFMATGDTGAAAQTEGASVGHYPFPGYPMTGSDGREVPLGGVSAAVAAWEGQWAGAE